jgi:hypothetical protein
MLSFGAELAGVTATGADNAWAVGSEHPAAEGKKIQPLIIGWDGRSWSVQASPPLPPGAVSGELTGVAASSADNAWAVGNYGIGTVHQPLILQSNGTSWTQIRSPDLGGPGHSSFLTSVTVVSPHDAWAAGYYRSAGFAGYRTLILHWNGTTWSQVPTPAPSPAHQGQLYGITATSPRNAWAAGYQLRGATRL